ncbi:hypothetical protein B0H14DRAFT_3895456, partial [Mycena olivaceomarginata]
MTSFTPAFRSRGPLLCSRAAPPSVDPQTVAAIQHLALAVSPPVATAAPVVPLPAGFQTQGPWVAGALYLVVPLVLLRLFPRRRPLKVRPPSGTASLAGDTLE